MKTGNRGAPPVNRLNWRRVGCSLAVLISASGCLPTTQTLSPSLGLPALPQPSSHPQSTPTVTPSSSPSTNPSTQPSAEPSPLPSTSPSILPTSGLYPSGVGYRGINRAGFEYGSNWNGWVLAESQGYANPTSTEISAELTYLKSKGFNLIRLPMAWERVQHTLYGALDTVYINGGRAYANGSSAQLITRTGYKQYVDAATTAGFTVIIDVHNYNRYAIGAAGNLNQYQTSWSQHVMGDGTLTMNHLADLWTKLAAVFADNPHVIFNIMNEAHDFPTSDYNTWMKSSDYYTGVQAVINGIRSSGADQLILEPNRNGSDVGHFFVSETSAQITACLKQNLSNCVSDEDPILVLKDSVNNMAIDIHSYFPESYGSGSPISAYQSNYAKQLGPVTAWARLHGQKLFLSELGVDSQLSGGQSAVNSLLTFMNTNSDVWQGWSPWDISPYYLTNNSDNGSQGPTKDTTAITTADGTKGEMPYYAPFLTAGLLGL